MAETSGQPEEGVAYPLTLGSSFDRNDSHEYLTMRIDFIPASADRTAEANLHIDPETHTVRYINIPLPSQTPEKRCHLAAAAILPIFYLSN